MRALSAFFGRTRPAARRTGPRVFVVFIRLSRCFGRMRARASTRSAAPAVEGVLFLCVEEGCYFIFYLLFLHFCGAELVLGFAVLLGYFHHFVMVHARHAQLLQRRR